MKSKIKKGDIKLPKIGEYILTCLGYVLLTGIPANMFVNFYLGYPISFIGIIASGFPFFIIRYEFIKWYRDLRKRVI